MNARTRGLGIRLSAFVLVAIVVVLLGLRLQAGQAGPGPVPTTDPIGVEYEFATGQATTWGTTLPTSGSASPVTLISVEPQGVSGLEVVGIRACDRQIPGCAVVNAAGWPLTGIETVAVEGLTLRPKTSQTGGFQLLIGVRRKAEAVVGAIAAIKLKYTDGKSTYEVIQPWALQIDAPGTLVLPSE